MLSLMGPAVRISLWSTPPLVSFLLGKHKIMSDFATVGPASKAANERIWQRESKKAQKQEKKMDSRWKISLKYFLVR